MGNGVCNCSGPAKRGQEDLLANEARQNSSKQTSSSTSISRESNQSEECNEAPIKQNKKIEEIPTKKTIDSHGKDRSNNRSNDDNSDETMEFEYVMNSTHNITKIMDADAAKAHNDDDDDEEDESLSDLSDGFDANGITIDMKPQKKKSEHKDLLRFRSKAKWDPGALDDHEKDMLAEMRRLSVSRGTGP